MVTLSTIQGATWHPYVNHAIQRKPSRRMVLDSNDENKPTYLYVSASYPVHRVEAGRPD
jgi:hypothetical protein